MDSLSEILKGLPAFLAYFGTGFGLTVVFLLIYMWVTPHDELKLIRAGNSAATLSLAGAMIGFILALAIVIAHNASIRDVLIWGLIALIVQIIAFFIARLLLPGLPKAIEDGKLSVGAFAGAISLGIGILNAACQT